MSCNHCDTKFSFFNKELGCANCGLALCSKCLQQKCKIPSKGDGKWKVCRTCFRKLISRSDSSEDAKAIIIPPDRFLKRLEQLENPSAPPITVYRQNPKTSALRTGLSPADQALVERLEKLKEKPAHIPTENEIRERLAKLKGTLFESSSEKNKTYYVPPDTRTDQEKANSLLNQFAGEVEIDASHQSQDDIAERLASLKDEKYRKNKHDLGEDEPDPEGEVRRIARKIAAEVSLDERCGVDLSKIPTDDEDARPSSPELPWCILCNEDAKFRCYDCGGDLYCSACNKEIHTNWGDTDHKVIPYKQNC